MRRTGSAPSARYLPLIRPALPPEPGAAGTGAHESGRAWREALDAERDDQVRALQRSADAVLKHNAIRAALADGFARSADGLRLEAISLHRARELVAEPHALVRFPDQPEGA